MKQSSSFKKLTFEQPLSNSSRSRIRHRSTDMNATLKFYSAVLAFLKDGENTPENHEHLMELAKTGKSSWKFTTDDLGTLWLMVNDSDEIKGEWPDTQDDFVIAAFKDLSQMREPKAAELLEQLWETSPTNQEEYIVWARKIKERKDGSGVLILHVSSVELFKQLVRGNTGHGDLKEGFMVYL